jgi:hypothetical protein
MDSQQSSRQFVAKNRGIPTAVPIVVVPAAISSYISPVEAACAV